MSSVRAQLAAWLLAGISACGSDPRAEPAPGGSAGSRADGGRAGTSGSNAGEGGGDDGSLGDGGARNCGNRVVEEDEQCEPGIAVPSCEALGFGRGTAVCLPGCRLDDSDCERVERCADGGDNDADGDTDCADPDCEATCGNACAQPESLLSDAVRNSNLERTSSLRVGCGGTTPGPDVVYSLEIRTSGMLEVTVTSGALLAVAIRSTCESAASERACALGGAAAEVEAGETVFIVVQGLEAVDRGVFDLSVRQRAVGICGDGHRDPAEDCDDENLEPGDGCDAECVLEVTEREPNQTPATANAFEEPSYARIEPEGDLDVFGFEVPEGHNSVFISTSNFGDGACAKNQLDSFVELLSSDGAVVAADDDGGDGLCASLVHTLVVGGTYFARVRGAPGATPSTFPYRLNVFIDTCGDGRLGPLEACDDSNVVAGDGCDATCELE